MERIYLDHAATTPVHPEVFQAMKPYYETVYGNPSSIHQFGREARRVLDESRESFARMINASYDEIIFTSGGTEADNLAIIGYAMANQSKGSHLITTKVEHHGVLHAFEHLENNGFDVTYLDVDKFGIVSINQLESSLTDKTILVSVMFGNNEVGTIQPLKEIGQVLANHQAVFHSDAVQSFGIELIDVKDLQVDLLTTSGHKVNGPKGVGFLYAKTNLSLAAMLHGGEQERKRRAGTENIPAIVGMKKAAELLISEREVRKKEYKVYREMMLSIFTEENLDFRVNGHEQMILSHILNVSFPGINIESLLMNLDLAGVAVSSGSACTAGSINPSHVLTAMFDEQERSDSALRFSFGYGNSQAQIEKAANIVVRVVRRLTNG